MALSGARNAAFQQHVIAKGNLCELRAVVKTSEDNLRSEIRTVENSLRAEIKTAENNLRSEINNLRAGFTISMIIGFIGVIATAFRH